MDWIKKYQLFLFDFDGLLVNTEEIHYLAYRRMCANHDVDLTWDFNRYCQLAHYESDALRKQIYIDYPKLHEIEPDWNTLYAEKREIVISLLKEGIAKLMPGVEKLLSRLQEANIKRCVVTHSPDELVNVLRQQHPILNTIPLWITREHYSHPKPNPECYLKAIKDFAETQDSVVGFEDTPRGIRALQGTRATPVLICQAQYPEIPEFVKQGVKHHPTFDELSL